MFTCNIFESTRHCLLRLWFADWAVHNSHPNRREASCLLVKVRASIRREVSFDFALLLRSSCICDWRFCCWRYLDLVEALCMSSFLTRIPVKFRDLKVKTHDTNMSTCSTACLVLACILHQRHVGSVVCLFNACLPLQKRRKEFVGSDLGRYYRI